MIVGYSDGSRRGLLKHLTTHQRDATPAFGTFTTPDRLGDPPGPVEVERMRKGLFDAIRKRPEFVGVGANWLREWERRREGTCAGLYVAHLHILFYVLGGWTPRSLTNFGAFAADVWESLGGGRSEVELSDNAEATRYYLVKPEKVTTPEDRASLLAAFPKGTGRAWGRFRRANLPTVEGVERTVTAAEFDALHAKAVAEANATYRALGSSHRYRDLPQNRRVAVSVGQPERFLREARRCRRAQAADRQPLKQSALNGAVCAAYALMAAGLRISANETQPEISIFASHTALRSRRDTIARMA